MVHAVSFSPTQFPKMTGVRTLGGLHDGYARGVFAVNNQHEVYTVYWEGGWKTKYIYRIYFWTGLDAIRVVSHNGKLFVPLLPQEHEK